jgi:D-beta-D-heptose 7-phosphate kinase/D-beta-D-heptose 1-phosphate adenosyltransferase
MSGKIIESWDELAGDLNRVRKGRKIVFTNGCFDILHVGHVRYLREAREQGDLLVVGLNTDASVRRLKGPDRPVNSEAARAEVLAALAAVDYITLFDQETPEELIRTVRPDVLVKGGDYTVETIVGAPFVMSYGGKVKTLQFVDGFSTTATIDKMKR